MNATDGRTDRRTDTSTWRHRPRLSCVARQYCGFFVKYFGSGNPSDTRRERSGSASEAGIFLLRLSIICVIALPVLARCQHYTPTNSAMNLISPLWNKTQSLADVCVWTLWGQCFMISILWSCELSKEIKATRIYGFCCMFSDFLTLHNFYVLSSRHLTKYRKYLEVNSRQWIRVGMSVQPTSWGLIVGTAVTVVDETKTSRSTAECPWW